MNTAGIPEMSSFFSPNVLLPCPKLEPTLPKMQLCSSEFDMRIACVYVGSE